MAKFDSKELKRALALIEKEAGLGTIDISFDPMERMLIKCTSTMGGDTVVITLFTVNDEKPNKMAEITRTSRL